MSFEKAINIDDFIKRVESTAEEDFFIPRTFYHLSSSMFHEMCELLKSRKPKPIVNKWHKNPLGDYLRLHCPWCDRELDMQSAKEYVACPYCGKAVKWNA